MTVEYVQLSYPEFCQLFGDSHFKGILPNFDKHSSDEEIRSGFTKLDRDFSRQGFLSDFADFSLYIKKVGKIFQERKLEYIQGMLTGRVYTRLAYDLELNELVHNLDEAEKAYQMCAADRQEILLNEIKAIENGIRLFSSGDSEFDVCYWSDDENRTPCGVTVNFSSGSERWLISCVNNIGEITFFTRQVALQRWADCIKKQKKIDVDVSAVGKKLSEKELGEALSDALGSQEVTNLLINSISPDGFLDSTRLLSYNAKLLDPKKIGLIKEGIANFKIDGISQTEIQDQLALLRPAIDVLDIILNSRAPLNYEEDFSMAVDVIRKYVQRYDFSVLSNEISGSIQQNLVMDFLKDANALVYFALNLESFDIEEVMLVLLKGSVRMEDMSIKELSAVKKFEAGLKTAVVEYKQRNDKDDFYKKMREATEEAYKFFDDSEYAKPIRIALQIIANLVCILSGVGIGFLVYNKVTTDNILLFTHSDDSNKLRKVRDDFIAEVKKGPTLS